MQRLELGSHGYFKICVMVVEESPLAWSKCPPSQKVIQKKAIIITPKIIFNQNKMSHLQFWSVQAFLSLLPCNQG